MISLPRICMRYSGCVAGNVPSSNREPSRIGCYGSGDYFNQRRLARAIFSDKRVYLTRSQIKRHTVQGADTGVFVIAEASRRRDGIQRRNASGTPPSTGIICPVVFALSSLASQTMAFAQSRGKIGCCVMVRRA
jgi:hypothetical protein